MESTVDTPPRAVTAALAALREVLAEETSLVVAFSGGADSSFLARVATDVLGADRVRCVTAVSPSLASAELDDCRSLAEEWGLRWEVVHTSELDDPAYVRNDGDRCFHCKSALSDAVEPIVAATGSTVVLGVNVDDLGDHRPGQRAAAERGARFPLVEAGFTKALVREASRHLGLRTADKPAAPCLASRIPYGTPVTIGILQGVEAAEAALRRLGFAEVRVRHHDDEARIEVPVDRIADLVAVRPQVVSAVRAAGYRDVTIDLDGFRSGNLNRALDLGR